MKKITCPNCKDLKEFNVETESYLKSGTKILVKLRSDSPFVQILNDPRLKVTRLFCRWCGANVKLIEVSELAPDPVGDTGVTGPKGIEDGPADRT